MSDCDDESIPPPTVPTRMRVDTISCSKIATPPAKTDPNQRKLVK